MSLRVDMKRAGEVVLRLHEAFGRREGLLADVGDLVENQIPPGVKPLSRDHANFLFFVVVNDHGMKSTRLYEGAKRLFVARRDLFEPAAVLDRYSGPEDEALVAATGTTLGTRYPRETAKRWYVNAAGLVERHAGDARHLFGCRPMAADLLREIRKFRGYGPKTGGMLLRAVVGLGFAAVSGLEQVLVPVDVHDSRISVLTGILKGATLEDFGEGHTGFVPVVQRAIRDACHSQGVSWLDVDRALWLIGSRGCAARRCSACPVSGLCERDATADRGARLPDAPGRQALLFDPRPPVE